MCSQFQDTLEERFAPMNEAVEHLYQLVSENTGQAQNQSRFGQNGRNSGGYFQRQFQRGNGNSGQRRNWQNGQNKGQGFNGSNVQCSYCKRQRHTVATCIPLREELRRMGFKISKGNGFGSNFRPGQGKGKGGFGNRNQFQNRGKQDQLNCMNDSVSDDEK